MAPLLMINITELCRVERLVPIYVDYIECVRPNCRQGSVIAPSLHLPGTRQREEGGAFREAIKQFG